MNYKVLLMSIMTTFYMQASSNRVSSEPFEEAENPKYAALVARVQALEEDRLKKDRLIKNLEKEVANKVSINDLSEILSRRLAECDYLNRKKYTQHAEYVGRALTKIEKYLHEEVIKRIEFMQREQNTQDEQQKTLFSRLQFIQEQQERDTCALFSRLQSIQEQQERYTCALQGMETELEIMKVQLDGKIQLAHQIARIDGYIVKIDGYIKNMLDRLDRLEDPGLLPDSDCYHGPFEELDRAIASLHPAVKAETAPPSKSTSPAPFYLDPWSEK